MTAKPDLVVEPEPVEPVRYRMPLARVVELALAARTRTGGRFDPTVHDALVEAGEHLVRGA